MHEGSPGGRGKGDAYTIMEPTYETVTCECRGGVRCGTWGFLAAAAPSVFAPPKGGRLRDVPLPDSVAEALQEHIKKFPPVEIEPHAVQQFQSTKMPPIRAVCAGGRRVRGTYFFFP
ncbi:MAG TPA: hypothetical protein VIU15_29510 [Streptomyces sp.]